MNVAELKKRILRGFAHPELFYLPVPKISTERSAQLCILFYMYDCYNLDTQEFSSASSVKSDRAKFVVINEDTNEIAYLSPEEDNSMVQNIILTLKLGKYKIKVLESYNGAPNDEWYHYELNPDNPTYARIYNRFSPVFYEAYLYTLGEIKEFPTERFQAGSIDSIHSCSLKYCLYYVDLYEDGELIFSEPYDKLQQSHMRRSPAIWGFSSLAPHSQTYIGGGIDSFTLGQSYYPVNFWEYSRDVWDLHSGQKEYLETVRYEVHLSSRAEIVSYDKTVGSYYINPEIKWSEWIGYYTTVEYLTRDNMSETWVRIRQDKQGAQFFAVTDLFQQALLWDMNKVSNNFRSDDDIWVGVVGVGRKSIKWIGYAGNSYESLKQNCVDYIESYIGTIIDSKEYYCDGKELFSAYQNLTKAKGYVKEIHGINSEYGLNYWFNNSKNNILYFIKDGVLNAASRKTKEYKGDKSARYSGQLAMVSGSHRAAEYEDYYTK